MENYLNKISKLTALLIIGGIAFSGCFLNPDEPFGISCLKTIRTPELEINWCYEDLLTSAGLDYIQVIKKDSMGYICKSDNIVDVSILNKDTILIKFCGSPEKYNNEIDLPEKIFEFTIISDTTGKCKPEYRKSFSPE